ARSETCQRERRRRMAARPPSPSSAMLPGAGTIVNVLVPVAVSFADRGKSNDALMSVIDPTIGEGPEVPLCTVLLNEPPATGPGIRWVNVVAPLYIAVYIPAGLRLGDRTAPSPSLSVSVTWADAWPEYTEGATASSDELTLNVVFSAPAVTLKF